MCQYVWFMRSGVSRKGRGKKRCFDANDLQRRCAQINLVKAR
jgi:hypothetical protein